MIYFYIGHLFDASKSTAFGNNGRGPGGRQKKNMTVTLKQIL
jgi:hypothetical protein